MKIAEKIIRLRSEYDLTQEELGKIARASNKAVSTWEKGEKTPRIKYIQAICSHFGIDIHDFIDEETDVYKRNSPVPEKSTREWLEDLLVERGWVRRGEDITPTQAKFLIGMATMMDAFWDSQSEK